MSTLGDSKIAGGMFKGMVFHQMIVSRLIHMLCALPLYFWCFEIRSQNIIWELKLDHDVNSIESWKNLNDLNESMWSYGLKNWIIQPGQLTIISNEGSDDVYYQNNIDIQKSTMIEVAYEVIQNPTGADVKMEKTDDSAIKIYLVFKNGWTKKVLCFVHNETVYDSDYIQAQGSFKSNWKYINMNSNSVTKTISFTCDIYDLYELIFDQKDNLVLKEIGLRSDAKDTQSYSKAILKRLRIIKIDRNEIGN